MTSTEELRDDWAEKEADRLTNYPGLRNYIVRALRAAHKRGLRDGLYAAASMASSHADEDEGTDSDLCQGCGESIAGAIFKRIEKLEAEWAIG